MDRGESQGLGLPFTLAGGRRDKAHALGPPFPLLSGLLLPTPQPSSAHTAAPVQLSQPQLPVLAPLAPWDLRAVAIPGFSSLREPEGLLHNFPLG